MPEPVDLHLERFVGAAPEEVTRFFEESDALAITDAIRATDDATLVRLLGDEHFRLAGVEAILHRFAEFADPERLAAIDGVVAFDLDRPDGTSEEYVAGFAGGHVTVLAAGPGAEHPPVDVTIGAGMLHFVRMVTGQENAALLYLADRLRLEGDELLALAVGTVFHIPGSGVAAVDPTTLDPVDVSRAIADVSTAHLHEVMGGAFRELVVTEVFRRLPDFLDPRKAKKVDLAIGFRIEAPDGREPDRYLVEVRQGACAVTRDPAEGRRDATLVLDGPAFLRLVLGHVNPVRALLGGRIGLKGDRAKALAFNGIMRIPKP